MLEVFTSGPFATNAYLFASGNLCCIVDPAPGSSQEIFPFIEKNTLQPLCILLTHTHWDHIADVRLFKEKYQIPVYVHPEDRPNLEKPGSDGLPLIFPLGGVSADREVRDGDTIPIGSAVFRVIHTPGHSGGSVCFYESTLHILFSGDTLFQGTIGNLSFPTSDENRMWDSLKKLEQLPKETQVFPGHGGATTIGQETWLANAKAYFEKR